MKKKLSTKKTKTSQNTSQQKQVVALLLVVLVLILGAMAFVSQNGFEKVGRAYKGHQVRSMYTEESEKFEVPLQRLGIQAGTSPSSICRYTEIYDVPGKPLLCAASTSHYSVIGKDKATQKDFVVGAIELDELVAQNGWKKSTNIDENFEQWMSDVVSGVDYHPGVGATIITANGICEVTMSIAYANPAPPAINTQFVCNTPAFSDIAFPLSDDEGDA